MEGDGDDTPADGLAEQNDERPFKAFYERPAALFFVAQSGQLLRAATLGLLATAAGRDPAGALTAYTNL